MTVAVLCCSARSIYRHLPNVVAYGKAENATSFSGGCPVVAHPPCRSWSAYCSHQSKGSSEEKQLGLFCAEKLRQNGGVLEHPAHSRLFEAANLPRPGLKQSELWTAEVWQCWWGYPMRKRTWLCFCGISPSDVHFPFNLHPIGGDRRREQLMSKNQRSATTMQFATWLVDSARKAKRARK